jgi:hypothetical protein
MAGRSSLLSGRRACPAPDAPPLADTAITCSIAWRVPQTAAFGGTGTQRSLRQREVPHFPQIASESSNVPIVPNGTERQNHLAKEVRDSWHQ